MVKRRWWWRALAVTLTVLAVCTTLLLATPGGAWYLFPSARPWLADLLLWRYKQLSGRSINSVHALLNDPDAFYQPYVAVMFDSASMPIADSPHYSGYYFHVGTRGAVTLVGPATPLRPGDAQPFDPQTWRQATPAQRRLMLPALVAHYRDPAMDPQQRKLDRVLADLGDGYIGEQWLYHLDGQDLVVRFDRSRRVLNVQRWPRGARLRP